MSITYVSTGNLLDSGADLLIAPICTVPGVMGAGLAKAFAERCQGLKDEHRRIGRAGGLIPGGVAETAVKLDGRWVTVVFAATKDHWREPSRIEWVEGCLVALTYYLDGAGLSRLLQRELPRSIAMPALGCGLGGLAWDDVRPLIVGTAELFPAIDWLVYPPTVPVKPINHGS